MAIGHEIAHARDPQRPIGQPDGNSRILEHMDAGRFQRASHLPVPQGIVVAQHGEDAIRRPKSAQRRGYRWRRDEVSADDAQGHEVAQETDDVRVRGVGPGHDLRKS